MEIKFDWDPEKNLGISNNSKVLVVCHCYRENDEVIRIISARKATTNEKKQYGEN